MDRLVKPDVKEIELIYKRGQKCTKSFRITNLMHTMSVAISLSTTKPSLFTFNLPLSIIPPLSTATYTIISLPSDQPAIPSPPDMVSVQSSMLPTWKAHENNLQHLFDRPGPHIFKDATIPISFVGFEVIEFLIPRAAQFPDIDYHLNRSIPWCDQAQLTTLLRSAISRQDKRTVLALIDAGADVNRQETDGKSLLSIAIGAGNLEVLKTLVSSGTVADNSVDLVLHEAAELKRVDFMEVLCRGLDEADINRVDSNGRIPIHVAAANGSVEVVRFCVSAGGDPNVVDSNGWTPLHCAAENGHLGVVEFLLECPEFDGKTVINSDGKTAFGLAVENNHNHLYDSLQLGDQLHRAARVGDVNGIRSCLLQGADVNSRDQNGWTPLHRAAFKGRTECVRALLSGGADVDAADEAGYTALHCAVETGRVETAMVLVAHGAKASVKSLRSCCFPLKNFDRLMNRHASSPVGVLEGGPE
ncbi:ankyrin repeat domain-containing protein 50-like [Punica granatum]|uniref:MSP domain-containing protein n=2 Tax=Punica granatum TaxID=22663 RepID=A0A218WYT7_PUNGR|nr:ankyrin repeat domain-containing protein 50-like [Punica granatum]OWM78055.1 hypothetical protein CDL15_Pgr018624 [Punica granatum]PKI59423.1 hypothetical protein CRG98_020182 [Punica granatum]